LIARSGLIAGPGDRSDRAGYWIARAARDPHGPMLIPDSPQAVTQAIDVRDLAVWLLTCIEHRRSGIYDTVGRPMALEEWIALSRSIGRHTGPVVRAEDAWLLAQGVEEFMGPESLPLWVADPEWLGFSARSGGAAMNAGLACRPVAETLRDTFAWERQLGLERERKSGLSAEREAELIRKLLATRGA
jgi:hypothetical protein